MVFFFLLAFWSCENDETIRPDENELYTPYLRGTRNNSQVNINWVKPICLFDEISNYSQLEPDHFEILISENNQSQFEFHSKVENNVFEVVIENLINGKPYYIVVKAVIGNRQYKVSNTIMIIPNNPENIQPLFQNINSDRKLGSWSHDEISVAYVSDYTWDNGNYGAQSIFISILLNNEEYLIEKNSYSPEWSPIEKEIVYHTDNGEINTSQGYRPTHIAIYNNQDSSIKRLTSGNSFNFVPTWSSDGKWIAFLSDVAGSNEYNLWKIPSDSGAVTQITTDFNDLTDLAIKIDRSLQKPCWSKDGSEIAFSRLSKLNDRHIFDIYAVPSTGGDRRTIVSSQWNDKSPNYSPDGTEIAFISDRSGSNEIWTMNLNTKELKQITGSYDFSVYVNLGKIEWSTSGDKILFTSYFENLKTLYTVNTN